MSHYAEGMGVERIELLFSQQSAAIVIVLAFLLSLLLTTALQLYDFDHSQKKILKHKYISKTKKYIIIAKFKLTFINIQNIYNHIF
ncbi:MAG: hypothetical protein FWG20_06540 [Candidatus Cloacimonetes bacterium]|nr:hypothetical protein [Candidatus Cloacimonadota bacterium]